MTRHDDVIELLEGYVLDALEPDETQMVEDHLETCAACRARLAEHREVLAGLPAVVGSVSPLRLHPAVKRNVLRAMCRRSSLSPAGIRIKRRTSA